MKSITTLKTLSYIILVLGILGSIIIWITLGTVQDPDYKYLDTRIANPQGIILGFEILISSILLWSFSLVICVIGENLIEIRKSLNTNQTNKQNESK